MSSSDSTRKMPRCPPESAGLSTAGKPTSSAARRRSDERRAAPRTAAAARRPRRAARRIATLCVIRCAVSTPIPGSPRASATAATTGTARSADTVSTPSSFEPRRRLRAPRRRRRSRRPCAMSASASPSASGLRSTAATRSPSSFARRIARRWWRPAPTKRTVFTASDATWATRSLPSIGRRSTLARVALEGKRSSSPAAPASSATTLARELVDRNEIVAVRQPAPRRAVGHRARRPPELRRSIQGDVLDADALQRLARGRDAHRPLRRDRRRRHGAREPGADDARQRDRHLQRARGGARDARRRSSGSSTSRRARSSARTPSDVSEGQVSTIGSVGEARWTYAVSKLAGEHMAHAYHDELRPADRHGAPVQRLRPGPDRRRRDPRVHRGGARRARPDDPRRRLADPRLVLRDRHGRAACSLCLEHPEAVGQAFNIGNPRSAVTIFDLAQRIKRLTGAPGEIVFAPLALRRRRAADPERREGARAARLGAAVELDDGLERTIAWYREKTPASV